jgi:uncharacterized protein YecA (UPF0149 family)
MAKYKRADTLEDESNETYSEELQKEQVSTESRQDDSWEKRYGDLRRHTQQQMADKDRKVQEMHTQLEQATKGQIKFPKTDQEIEQWSKKYPEVAKIVDTIARKRANEALEEGEKRMKGLKDLETKLTRKEAEQHLLKMHPDFSEIRSRKDFHDWVALQPQHIQDSLYKNNTDAYAAARSIDLYKSDGERRKKNDPKSAAKAVSRTSTAPAPTGGRAKFSESQVARMSEQDYAKYEDQILEAMRNGNFTYDMTGGAR